MIACAYLELQNKWQFLQCKIIVFQGQFSSLSAFSVGKIEQSRRFHCNSQYLLRPAHTSLARHETDRNTVVDLWIFSDTYSLIYSPEWYTQKRAQMQWYLMLMDFMTRIFSDLF